MQCPECKSRSVVVKDGKKICEAKGCTFIQFHVITYENQNRQFEGEKGAQNRFNSTGVSSQSREKQSLRYQKNFYRGSTVIKNLIHTMKLSNDLQDRAEAKLLQVLKVKYPQQKKQQKLSASDDHLAAYCLWLACCDKRMEFKDVRIANEMQIAKKKWQQIHNQMQLKFKSTMNIPMVTTQQIIRRVCRKRKINQIQVNAMLQLAENIKKQQLVGSRKKATAAACIFWQIMIRSSTYNNKDVQFDIKQYLAKSNDDQNKQKYWTQTQFQISLDAIKRFKTQQLDSDMNRFMKMIPNFKTRIPIPEDKGRNSEDRTRA